MARSKVETMLIGALGDRREQLYAEIKQMEEAPNLIDEKKAELAEIESKLKEIDPEIPSKEEEVAAAQAREDAINEAADAEIAEVVSIKR